MHTGTQTEYTCINILRLLSIPWSTTSFSLHFKWTFSTTTCLPSPVSDCVARDRWESRSVEGDSSDTHPTPPYPHNPLVCVLATVVIIKQHSPPLLYCRYHFQESQEKNNERSGGERMSWQSRVRTPLCTWHHPTVCNITCSGYNTLVVVVVGLSGGRKQV